MAEYLSSIGTALSQIFAPDLHRQWNRVAPLLSLLSARGDVGDGKGKNVAFDVEFSGNQALTVAEGSDVATSEYTSDVDVPAILPWAHYRSAFQISETEFNAAMSSMGTPDALRNLFSNRIMGGGHKIMQKIEQDLLSGTGVDASGNPTIVGFYGGALVTSGDYAGISTAAYPEWASNILANGGVSRALTTDLLAQADGEIFSATNEPWDVLTTSVGVSRKFEYLFTNATFPMTRMNDSAKDPAYGVGVVNDSQGQPTNLFYKGHPVIRNTNNPSGKVLLLNSSKVEIKYLPHQTNPNDAAYTQIVEGEAGNGSGVVQATKIPIRIAALAKTGESYKFMMTATVQMCVTRPGAFATIADVSEV